MSKKMLFLTSFVLLLAMVGNARAELRLWYMFDEAADANVAADSSGNGFDGIATDANFTGAGGGYDTIGGALDFNDGDPQVSVPNGVFATISDHITIALWIFGDPCTQPINQDMWYADWPGSTDNLFAHIPWGDTNNILFNVGEEPGTDWEVFEKEAGDASIYRGQWNHWVWIKNGGQMEAYLNGELWNSNDGYTNPIPPITNFVLGNGYDGPYDGLVDDFAIWDNPLSAGEVALVYNNGVAALLALAKSPDPANGAEQVALDVVLKWEPGLWTASTSGHEVYFGTDMVAVENADRFDLSGIYQDVFDVNNYDPPEALELAKTYYWRVDEVNEAYSGTNPPTPPDGRWKGPVWSFRTAGQAWNPSPADAAEDVELDVVLSWTQGIVASKHDVYFGDDYNSVRDATTSTALIYRGRQIFDNNSYDPPEALTLGQTYYWRIDEVNSSDIPEWPGDIWSFIIAEYLVVDDMDSYQSGFKEIYVTWLDYYFNDTGAAVFIETSPDLVEDGHSMRYEYNNASGGGSTTLNWSEIEADTANLEIGSDWALGGTRRLAISFYGNTDQTGNDPTQKMWLALEDNVGHFAIVFYDGDMNDIRDEEWQQWNIALQDFADINSVDLANVAKVYIGFGERGSTTKPDTSGRGTVYFDNFRLYPPSCVPAHAIGDLTEDCFISLEDLDLMAVDWLDGDYTVVPVTPVKDPCGWWEFNEGMGTTVGDSSGNGYDGTFAPSPNEPTWFDDPCRGWCVEFDGNDILTVPAGAFSSVSTEVTIALWMYGRPNDVQHEHDIFYANDDKLFSHIPWPSTELVHWETDDGEGSSEGISKLAEPNDYSNGWNHWAFTKNADTGVMAIYLNGVLWYSEEGFHGVISGITDVKIGNGYDGGYIGLLDDFRVYDYALSEGEIANVAGLTDPFYIPLESPANFYDLEPPLQKKVNFNDYALMADNWLKEILFP